MYVYSTETVADFYSYLRKLTTLHYDGLPFQDQWIGSPGETVEIDESKFAKRKYNRGHKVGDKSWFFGGICRSSKEFFAGVIMDRTADTLLNIIREYIAPGTAIYSDGLRAHSGISDIPNCNYSHQVVNHSENFLTLKLVLTSIQLKLSGEGLKGLFLRMPGGLNNWVHILVVRCGGRSSKMTFGVALLQLGNQSYMRRSSRYTSNYLVLFYKTIIEFTCNPQGPSMELLICRGICTYMGPLGQSCLGKTKLSKLCPLFNTFLSSKNLIFLINL